MVPAHGCGKRVQSFKPPEILAANTVERGTLVSLLINVPASAERKGADNGTSPVLQDYQLPANT